LVKAGFGLKTGPARPDSLKSGPAGPKSRPGREAHKPTYNERLRLLGLQRLELRRLHCDLLFMFKLTHGITDCQLLKRAITHAPRSGLRGHRYKLLVPSAKSLY
jgi:hypothetical protein